jgi:hypothetical protein
MKAVSDVDLSESESTSASVTLEADDGKFAGQHLARRRPSI